MPSKKQNKKEVEKEIKEFFKDIRDKTSKEVKKIKRKAMHYSIKLGKYRQLFCKYCLTPYNKESKIRIKKKKKIIECSGCGSVNRIKI